MKRTSLLLLIFIGSSLQARAHQNLCPWDTSDITLEQEHHQPGPILIIPDVVKNENKPDEKVEYNYVSRFPQFDMTVHCYKEKRDHQKIDVLLPKGIKKCTFYKKQFWCE